jgi:hypothetical protein
MTASLISLSFDLDPNRADGADAKLDRPVKFGYRLGSGQERVGSKIAGNQPKTDLRSRDGGSYRTVAEKTVSQG